MQRFVADDPVLRGGKLWRLRFCPGDARRSLGMFLYKALKHRDEEEYFQVRAHWLGDTGRPVG